MSTLLIPRAAGTVTSVNTKTGVVTLSTVDIPEVTNLYFTNARARTALSFTSSSTYGLVYDSSTGVMLLCAEANKKTPFTLAVRDANGVLWCGGVSAPAGNSYFDQVSASRLTITDTLSVANKIVAFDVEIYDTLKVYSTATFYSNIVYNGTLTVNGISGVPWMTDGFIARKSTSVDVTPLVAGTTVFALNTGLSSIYSPVNTTDPLSSAFSKLNAQVAALSAFLIQLGKTV